MCALHVPNHVYSCRSLFSSVCSFPLSCVDLPNHYSNYFVAVIVVAIATNPGLLIILGDSIDSALPRVCMYVCMSV